MLRRRKYIISEVIEKAKNLDAFGKLEDDYQVTSPARGTVSILVFSIILLMIIFEIKYFLQKQPKYSYDVDFEYEEKLKLNIDMTVAMTCSTIGADVLDSSSRDMLSEKSIDMEDTWFELSPNQKNVYNHATKIYDQIREHYHALHTTLWLSNDKFIYNLPIRENVPSYPKDACRIHGTFELNKISGNLHVIPGRSVSFFGNHAHMVNMFNNIPNNFSHRIDKFSFGENSNLIHNALNSELKLANSVTASFQYFITIVSTELSYFSEKNTFQYSVTEKHREIDHSKESHGTPGIIFKYDISPIRVKVELENRSYLELAISLIGIIGGVFSTTYMINSFFQNLKDSIAK